MLVCTVHASARVSEFALNLRVDVETLVTICAFREEFARFCWMMILTLLGTLITLGPVFAADHALVTAYFHRFRPIDARWKAILVFLITTLCSHLICLDRSESLKSLATNLFRLLLVHIVLRITSILVVTMVTLVAMVTWWTTMLLPFWLEPSLIVTTFLIAAL